MPDLMWEHLFKNEGVWNGNFTRLSPDGTIESNTPSRIILERTSDTSARFEIARYPQGRSPQEHKTEFANINRSSVFFEDGSFSKGSMQLSPMSEFGIELSVTQPSARQRLVQIFKPGGELDYLISIRETRNGAEESVRPPINIEDLIGVWSGIAIAYSPGWSIADPVETELKVEATQPERILYEWRVGTENGRVQAELKGPQLLFEHNTQPYQLLLLDNGASSLCPLAIRRHASFQSELGWLLEPTKRMRVIRNYQSDGSWSGQLWIQEEKIA